jgi:hypothetical protein
MEILVSENLEPQELLYFNLIEPLLELNFKFLFNFLKV